MFSFEFDLMFWSTMHQNSCDCHNYRSAPQIRKILLNVAVYQCEHGYWSVLLWPNPFIHCPFLAPLPWWVTPVQRKRVWRAIRPQRTELRRLTFFSDELVNLQVRNHQHKENFAVVLLRPPARGKRDSVSTSSSGIHIVHECRCGLGRRRSCSGTIAQNVASWTCRD